MKLSVVPSIVVSGSPCVCVCVCVCVRACACVCVCIRMYVCAMHVRTVAAYIYTCMHTYMCTYVHAIQAYTGCTSIHGSTAKAYQGPTPARRGHGPQYIQTEQRWSLAWLGIGHSTHYVLLRLLSGYIVAMREL